MGEAGHNVTLGTHGTALYRELLHVPMIFFIPDNRPREIGGAVSNLDVVPTIAALCHISIDDLALEGRSLVPQLFYGKEDHERIVFSETNAPGKQRAAISEHWRLIFNLSSNLYELYDQTTDFLEKVNLAPKDPPELAVMKRALELWMSRVMYTRDPLFNQAYRQMSDVILQDPPTPAVKTTGQMIGGEASTPPMTGKVEILGIGPADGKPLVPGTKAELHVYFHVVEPPTLPYRFQFVVWPATVATPLTEPTPPSTVRGPARATADGAYPPDRWKQGDYIRERFPFNVPTNWKDGVAIGLVVTNPKTGEKLRAAGAAPSNDPTILSLGVLPMGSQPSPRP